MSLKLINIGKEFNNEWIFKNINYQFEIPGTYVIRGANGSGKSTLLKIISSYQYASQGKQELTIKSKNIPSENWNKHIAFAAPYIELIEEMFVGEFIDFYIKFKPLVKGILKKDIIRDARLQQSISQQIQHLSSGMKQRLKLTLAWHSNTSILLLDEPCSNLDKNGIEWYKNLAKKYSKDKLVIVCSNNIHDEYFFCENRLNIEDFNHCSS